MKGVIFDLLVPPSDRLVFIQVGVILALWLVSAVAVRRNRDLLHFVTGLALVALGWRAVLTLH